MTETITELETQRQKQQ